MHLHFSFDACPMHSSFGFVHLMHQNLSAHALFCLNSLAEANTQLLIYNWKACSEAFPTDLHLTGLFINRKMMFSKWAFFWNGSFFLNAFGKSLQKFSTANKYNEHLNIRFWCQVKVNRHMYFHRKKFTEWSIYMSCIFLFPLSESRDRL